MKKYITIILLITSCTLCFSQKINKDTPFKIYFSDIIKSKKINNILEKDYQLNFFFQESPIQTDYFKYVFPIITLLLGITVNKLLDYLKDRKQMKKIGERWKAELSSLELPIEKQIKYLVEFLREHDKKKFDTPELKIVITLECDFFSLLDKSELIKFIEIQLKKSYKDSVLFSSKISSFILILKSHNEECKIKFNKYVEECSPHIKKLSPDLEKLLKEFENYKVTIEKEVNKNPSRIAISRNISDLFQNEIKPKILTGDFEIYKLETSFFEPFSKLLKELQLDEKTKILFDISSECCNSIKAIQMEKQYLSKNIKELTSDYEESLKNLKEIISDFT